MKNLEKHAIESVLENLTTHSDVQEKLEIYAQRKKELMEMGSGLITMARTAIAEFAEELSPEAIAHYESEVSKLLKMNFTYHTKPTKTN